MHLLRLLKKQVVVSSGFRCEDVDKPTCLAPNKCWKSALVSTRRWASWTVGQSWLEDEVCRYLETNFSRKYQEKIRLKDCVTFYWTIYDKLYPKLSFFDAWFLYPSRLIIVKGIWYTTRIITAECSKLNPVLKRDILLFGLFSTFDLLAKTQFSAVENH